MGKGRDPRLIIERDKALLRRYYYWWKVEGKRHDETLKILMWQEFFLAEETIERILRDKADLLPELINEMNNKKTKSLRPRLTKAQKAILTGQSALPFDL